MMTLEELYAKHCQSGTAIAAHLPRLRQLATGCELAVEFGVKRGGSSTALLLGAARVLSFDVLETASARQLEELVGERWTYRLEDSRRAHIPPCDLLFIDSLHTYEQVRAELDRHADQVQRWLVFHDVTTFGEVGAVGETGRQAWQYTPGKTVPANCYGIRPAIDGLMIRDPSWHIHSRVVDSHGLLVLERR